VSSQFLALLLIFGLGHPSREPLDPAKGAQLHGRIKCDGYGVPEDLLRMHPSFSKAGSQQFVLSRYEVDKCSVETMFQCWHKQRIEWRDVWSATGALLSNPGVPVSPTALVPIDSCYEWGSSEPAQYVLSGWYNEGSDSKPMWRQVQIKQLSAQPETYEFTDPNGGIASLQITR